MQVSSTELRADATAATISVPLKRLLLIAVFNHTEQRSGRLFLIRSLSEGLDELYFVRVFGDPLQLGSTTPDGVPQHGTTFKMDNPESA